LYAVRGLTQSVTDATLRPPLGTTGVGHIAAACCKPGLPLLSLWFGPPCAATDATTVGNNGDPVPPVRGADTASWKYKRPCFVTLSFQVSKHIVECHMDDSSNVFTTHPSGLNFVNNAEHFWPQVTVIILAAALPGA